MTALLTAAPNAAEIFVFPLQNQPHDPGAVTVPHFFRIIQPNDAGVESVEEFDRCRSYFKPKPFTCGFDIRRAGSDTELRAHTLVKILEKSTPPLGRTIKKIGYHATIEAFEPHEILRFVIRSRRQANDNGNQELEVVATRFNDESEVPPAARAALNNLDHEFFSIALGIDVDETPNGELTAELYLRPGVELGQRNKRFGNAALKFLSKFVSDGGDTIRELAREGHPKNGPRTLKDPFAFANDGPPQARKYYVTEDDWLIEQCIDLTEL